MDAGLVVNANASLASAVETKVVTGTWGGVGHIVGFAGTGHTCVGADTDAVTGRTGNRSTSASTKVIALIVFGTGVGVITAGSVVVMWRTLKISDNL